MSSPIHQMEAQSAMPGQHGGIGGNYPVVHGVVEQLCEIGPKSDLTPVRLSPAILKEPANSG